MLSALHGRKVEWGSLQRTATAVVDDRGDRSDGPPDSGSDTPSPKAVA